MGTTVHSFVRSFFVHCQDSSGCHFRKFIPMRKKTSMKWKIHAVHHVNYLEPIGYYVNKRTLLRHEINTIRQIGSIEEKIQRENLQKYAKIRAKSINKCIFFGI